jgi:hypothetical protein
LGTVEEHNRTDERISHGICRDCLEQFMAGSGESLDAFLESLEAPVCVVDEECRIIAANALAQHTISKDMGQIRGRLGGEVFGCEHSRLPGGCGHTVHCESCTIRNTVIETFETGKPCTRVPACRDLDTIAGPRRVRFTISTEKAGDAVLLRIDEAQPEDSLDSE